MWQQYQQLATVKPNKEELACGCRFGKLGKQYPQGKVVGECARVGWGEAGYPDGLQVGNLKSRCGG